MKCCAKMRTLIFSVQSIQHKHTHTKSYIHKYIYDMGTIFKGIFATDIFARNAAWLHISNDVWAEVPFHHWMDG